MRWLLAGCFGLALINISVALQIKQTPRFCGRFTTSSARIYCGEKTLNVNYSSSVKWHKADKYNSHKKELMIGERIETGIHKDEAFFLHINDLRPEDTGVYFCQINNTVGPGTELQIARRITYSQALYRTQVKDGLIIFQGLLCAICVAAILLRNQRLPFEKSDSIYEEPETDHIYEGLTIETCGGGLYEELSVYAQAEGTEAPWE